MASNLNHQLPFDQFDIQIAAEYLTEELARDSLEFIASKNAHALFEELKRAADDVSWRSLNETLKKLANQPTDQWALAEAWLHALLEGEQQRIAPALCTRSSR